jgi:hypothetical protein
MSRPGWLARRSGWPVSRGLRWSLLFGDAAGLGRGLGWWGGDHPWRVGRGRGLGWCTGWGYWQAREERVLCLT